MDAGLHSICQEYSFEDVVSATEGFSDSKTLGRGSYGTVYCGVLRDGTEVAIKELSSPNEAGFKEEVQVLSRFRHPNLVILLGFARQGPRRYLLYELLSGGDLCCRLQGDDSFDWRKRLSVILDAALGLSHLHCSQPQVFHRDIKSQNILLDRNGTGKMADFGLALLATRGCSSITVEHASGTAGYADPVYISTGRVTEQTEVYSFGAVLLEVLTGRPPALQDPIGRIEYQFLHLQGDLSSLLAMLDPRALWPPRLADQLGRLALLCINVEEAARPRFAQIVSELRRLLRESEQPAPLRADRVRQHSGGYSMSTISSGSNAPPQSVSAGSATTRASWGRNSYEQHDDEAWGRQNFHEKHEEDDARLIDDGPVPQLDCGPPPSAAEHHDSDFELVWLGPQKTPGNDQGVDPTISRRLQVELGFSAHQVAEAFKRCSTTEAAVDWILSPEREWNRFPDG